MAYYKEIVTKAVVGKGKKSTVESYTMTPENTPDTVLGCWITNNKFNGTTSNGDIFVSGNFDINIWYSYENNTKTGVASGKYYYNDKMNVRLNDNSKLTNDSEVIVNSLSDPNVIDVKVNNDTITFTVRKEMGIEVVGDTKIRINAVDDYDDYEEIIDEKVPEDVLNTIDNEVNEDYLEKKEDQ